MTLFADSGRAPLARNVAWLGLRMAFLLVVNLIVARLLLAGFGVDGYGEWVTVMSAVALGSFIPDSAGDVTMRFLSMARSASEAAARFRVSVCINAVASVAIVALACGAMLWIGMVTGNGFEDSTGLVALVAAMMFFKFMAQPYFGLMFARERVGMFAMFSVVEGLASLVCASLVNRMDSPLVGYAMCMMVVEAAVWLLCRICSSALVGKVGGGIDKAVLKKFSHEFAGFLGWVMFGGFAMTLWTHGATLACSRLYGLEGAAVMGIAMMVAVRMRGIVSGLQKGISPRIMACYRSDRLESRRLTWCVTAWSAVGVAVAAAVMAFLMPELLELWLGDVPEGLVAVMRVMLVIVVLDSIHGPLNAVIQAWGNMRRFELRECSVLLLMLPSLIAANVMGFGLQDAVWAFVAIDIIVTAIRLRYASIALRI